MPRLLVDQSDDLTETRIASLSFALLQLDDPSPEIAEKQ